MLLTLVLGIAYPLAVTGVAQVAFGSQADGSLVHRDGKVVGSTLIGQVYDDPAYFHGRPSAAGDGYDPLATSASNLGLDNPDLVKQVQGASGGRRQGGRNRARCRRTRCTARQRLWTRPTDQSRVRRAAGRPGRPGARSQRGTGSRAVADHTKGRSLGFLGEPRVDLLELNLALDQLG